MALGATDAPQVLLTPKSPELVPMSVMLVMLRVPVPVLVSTTVRTVLVVETVWLPKLSEDGLREIPADVAVPVPVNVVMCGVVVELSATDRLAVLVPAAVGVNVTVITQLAPEAIVPTQGLGTVEAMWFEGGPSVGLHVGQTEVM